MRCGTLQNRSLAGGNAAWSPNWNLGEIRPKYPAGNPAG
jgi:hypothetical protein